MALVPIKIDDYKTADNEYAKVNVVLVFGDLVGPNEQPYEIFDAYLMFDDYYLVFIDDEAIIATLTPSLFLPGTYEIDREVLAFQACDEIDELPTYAEKMSAAELIRLVAKFGLN